MILSVCIKAKLTYGSIPPVSSKEETCVIVKCSGFGIRVINPGSSAYLGQMTYFSVNSSLK